MLGFTSSLPRRRLRLAAFCLMIIIYLTAFASALPANNAAAPDGGASGQVKEDGRDHKSHKAAASFTHAFVAAFSMMIVSELGDKTFFIAAIMAMRHSRLVIFSGAIGALALMTVLSAYIGAIATLIPRVYTVYLSTALFVFFGLKMLREGYLMSDDEGAEELEEVTQELKAKEEELSQQEGIRHIISPVLLSAFSLTFLAEWGDRSQIATIILGAREDPLGVTLGAILGHSVATFIAVIGGRLLAQRISIRTVHLIGGVVFLLFAISGVLMEQMSFEDTVQSVSAQLGAN